ncbi:MAG: hypothetical protein GY856_36940 [bacterium]|nr:hypothetical protein [bacterium]
MLTAHHRRARSLGGGHDPETNGICLDWKCHRLIEDMAVPDWREWKDERGSNQ